MTPRNGRPSHTNGRSSRPGGSQSQHPPVTLNQTAPSARVRHDTASPDYSDCPYNAAFQAHPIRLRCASDGDSGHESRPTATPPARSPDTAQELFASYPPLTLKTGLPPESRFRHGNSVTKKEQQNRRAANIGCVRNPEPSQNKCHGAARTVPDTRQPRCHPVTDSACQTDLRCPPEISHPARTELQ